MAKNRENLSSKIGEKFLRKFMFVVVGGDFDRYISKNMSWGFARSNKNLKTQIFLESFRNELIVIMLII